MPITIRPVTEADDARRAELQNLASPETITAEDVREWRRSEDPKRITLRLGAEAEDGRLVAYAHALREPWDKPGVFWLHVVVDPAGRRQGTGALLHEELLRFARERGGTRYFAEVRDHLPMGLAFAERQGYHVQRHLFESTLDVAGFDEARFGGAVEAAERAGIRFLTLADVGDTEEARRRLWALNEALRQEVPGADGGLRPYEAFRKQVCEAAWYRPEGQILAVDGDRWIGLSALGYFATPQPMMWVMMTGVEREYRGRGIALALKLLGMRYARRSGARYIRTNNDSENAPILAVNRKLGFVPEPGYYRMLREDA